MNFKEICIDEGSCDIFMYKLLFHEYLNPEQMNESQIDMVKKPLGRAELLLLLLLLHRLLLRY